MYINDIYYCPGCMNAIPENIRICECGFDESHYEEQSHCLQIGTVLDGSIMLGKVISSGGFGITYIGLDMNLNRRVAVKEFFLAGYVERNIEQSNNLVPVDSKSEEIFIERRDKFIREARMLAKLGRIDSVVAITRFFRANNTAYIVMEYIEGMDIEKLIEQKGSLTYEELDNIVSPLVKSLSKVHRQNVIHRDIKPGNIILEKDGGIKLVDFGSAKEYSEDGDENTRIIVTPCFAAYEQYSLTSVKGPYTDVYGLCATMYNCITGVEPMEVKRRMYDDDDELIERELNAISKHPMNAVISKGMAIYPEDRYQDMEELLQAMKEAGFAGGLENRMTSSDASDEVSDHLPEASNASVVSEDRISNVFSNKLVWGIIVTAILLIALIVYSFVRDIELGEAGNSATTGVENLTSSNEATDITEVAEAETIAEPEKDQESDFEKDVEILRFWRKENSDSEQVSRACEVIETRLENVFSKDEYQINYAENEDAMVEVRIKLDAMLEKDITKKILANYILRPGTIGIVYNGTNFANPIMLDTDNLTVTRDDNPELMDWPYIQIGVSESMASKLSEYCDMAIARRGDDNFTYRDIFNNSNIYMDYYYGNRWNAELDEQDMDDKSTSVFSYPIRLVSEDYRKIYISTEDIPAIEQELIVHNIENNLFFEDVLDYEICDPVIWEDVDNIEDLYTIVGEYQRNADYFLSDSTGYTDVYYRTHDSEGDRIDACEEMKKLLDKLEIEYSIGRYFNVDNTIMLRLSNSVASPLLTYSMTDSILGYFEISDDDYSLSATGLNYGYSYITGISWDEGRIIVNIYGRNKFEGKCYYENEMKFLKQMENSEKVTWKTHISGQEDNILLYGTYDQNDNTITFTESTLMDDISIPDDMQIIVKLMSEMLSGNYETLKNCSESYYCCYGEENYSIQNRVKAWITEDVTKWLEDNTRLNITNVEYEYKEVVVYAECNLNRFFADSVSKEAAFLAEANFWGNEGIRHGDVSKCVLKYRNENRELQIEVDYENKTIICYRYDDEKDSEAREDFSDEFDRLVGNMSAMEEFSDYTITGKYFY